MPDSQNPYQSPQTVGAPQGDADGDEGQVVVEQSIIRGNNLLVRTKTVFPPVCVKTGRPIDEAEMNWKQIFWFPPALFALLFLLFFGLIAILIYMVGRKECRIKYGVHADIRRKLLRWMLIKLAVLFVLVVAAAIAFSQMHLGLGLWLTAGSFIALIVVFVGNDVLTAGGHDTGVFEIKGCGPEFLNHIRQMESQDL